MNPIKEMRAALIDAASEAIGSRELAKGLVDGLDAAAIVRLATKWGLAA